jgi:hypothetical protein
MTLPTQLAQCCALSVRTIDLTARRAKTSRPAAAAALASRRIQERISHYDETGPGCTGTTSAGEHTGTLQPARWVSRDHPGARSTPGRRQLHCAGGVDASAEVAQTPTGYSRSTSAGLGSTARPIPEGLGLLRTDWSSAR